jgi:hypothetical protein
MSNAGQKDQNNSSSTEDGQQKIAVPYIPPPPPEGSSQKKFKSPVLNGIIVAFVILLGGFMTYNFVGHSLTRTAGVSAVQVSPGLHASPTATPTPTPSY